MKQKPHKTDWWEAAAYKYVTNDIIIKIPDHLDKIQMAKHELARNARKKYPTQGCIHHNEGIIKTQLQKIGERFARWESRLSENGDAHRWEQVPGARRCVRINWKDILPSPTDQWDAHIPVFGLDVPDLKLLGPKDGSVSPGPETSSVGRRATRPATPYPRLTKPSSSYETQPATAKRLIVEVEEEGHLVGFKARMKKQPQNVNRHQPPQGRREPAMQHTLAATIPATYAPKRDRSASAGTDVEEEEYSGGLKIRTHKKVRFNAQQPTRGLADYILTRMPTNKHPVNPTLKRPYSLSTAASTAEDGELHNDNKAKNTSASSGMRNEPRQPQVFATPAQKRPFAQYTSTEPLTDRTRHISEMTTPSARPPKLQRLLFKKSSIGPTEKGSEEHDEEHRSFVFFEFPY